MTSPKSTSGSLNLTYGYLPTAVTAHAYDCSGREWPERSLNTHTALTTLTVASTGVNSAWTCADCPGCSSPWSGEKTKGESTAHLYATATSPSLTKLKSLVISSFTAP